jgi:outer membrane protein
MKTFLLALLFLTSAAGLHAQSTLTLDQAIRFAQENNHQVQLSQLNVKDAEAQILERKSFGIPQLSGEVNFNHFLQIPVTVLPAEFGLDPNTGQPNPNFNREVKFGLKNNLTGTLALRTMIFDPSYFVGLKAARAYRDYTAQDLVNANREVKYQIVEAYLPVLLIKEYLINLDANLENLENLRRETQALYTEGFAELLDVERLDLSLFTLTTERESLIAQQEMAINGLKMVMGWPMEKEVTIEGELLGFLVAADEKDLEGRQDYMRWPSYRVALQGLELANLNVKLNKYGYLPSLNGFANYQRMYMGDDFNSGFWANASLVGLGLKIPIFDGLLTHAQIQRAKITKLNTDVQIDMLQQQIDLSVKNARKAYLQAKDKLNSQERNLALAEKIYQTTRTKYREGVGSSLEINQAEQAMFSAQRLLVQARYDLIQAYYQLEKATGK